LNPGSTSSLARQLRGGSAGKSLDFIIGADGDDSISVDRQCLRGRLAAFMV